MHLLCNVSPEPLPFLCDWNFVSIKEPQIPTSLSPKPIMSLSCWKHCTGSALPSHALKLKTDIFRAGYWFSLQLPLSQLPILFSVCEPHSTSLSSQHVACSLSSLWTYGFTVPFALPHLSALSMDVTFSKKLFLASYVWVKCLYKLEMLLLTNIGKTQIRVAYTNRSLFFLHNKKCECRHLPVWFRKCIISGALYWWV